MIGGIPEVVITFVSNSADMISMQNVLSDIATSYYDDFAKYKGRIPVLRLREVMNSVVSQAGGKYIYSQAGPLSNPAQAKEALELLEMAGLVYKVCHSSGRGVPLGSEVNFKKFKSLLYDCGIFQQIAGLRISNLLIADFNESTLCSSKNSQTSLLRVVSTPPFLYAITGVPAAKLSRGTMPASST